MYSIEVRKSVEKTFKKIKKKDRIQFKAIRKKLKEIQMKPYAFKPLKFPKQNYWRVHIMKSFVLIYSIVEKKKKIIVEDYGHHDLIYK
jgi:YafQ family addiction module toxin component